HPATSIAQGSRRNCGVTQPPKVAALQSATNSTKNRMPRAIFAPRAIGTSGVSISASPKRIAGRRTHLRSRAPRSLSLSGRRLLHEAGVDRGVDIRLGLDDAGLEQEIGGFLHERLDLAAEELLVGGRVLPAKIGLRFLEILGALLHRR